MAEIAGPQVSQVKLDAWLTDPTPSAIWHVIETDTGALIGFQHAQPETPDSATIATFLTDPLPPGAATALFEATFQAARAHGLRWLTARMAGENQSAQTLYQSRGFRLYSSGKQHISMIYDLE